jgi:alpha-L-arabinofuranosidase
METEADAEVSVSGATKSVGRAIVLTSEHLSDENSFADPVKVAPREAKVNQVGPSFRHSFPPRSITVLRLKANLKSGEN